jgi:hypothetical protein
MTKSLVCVGFTLSHAFTNLPLGLVPVMEPEAVFVRAVDAAIPDDDFAGAILLRRDHAFERGIVVWVVFGLRGKALLAAFERRSFRHGPGQQHAVAFEAKVVMQLARRVLLHDEQQWPAPPRGQLCFRLGGGIESPLGGILAEAVVVLGHGGILNANTPFPFAPGFRRSRLWAQAGTAGVEGRLRRFDFARDASYAPRERSKKPTGDPPR